MFGEEQTMHEFLNSIRQTVLATETTALLVVVGGLVGMLELIYIIPIFSIILNLALVNQ